ncbi:MAG: amidase [Solirubrobacteraceae bacterium]|jgi:amidase
MSGPSLAAELCLLSAGELLELMRSGELSSVEVVSAHLERIAEVNPALNAIVTLAADEAIEQAKLADRARAADAANVGLLHGLPIGIKDLVDTAGMRTTYGSPIFREHVPVKDAAIVTLLRHAGAIVVGKTNTPEFGAGSHTFNAVFGVTRNPYDPTRSAGGSSGGAASALASGMLALADGTDLGGSLRNPASFCNVVGLRPSPGRVSTLPSSDLWDPMSVSGPMGRCVEDVALAMDVVAGTDPRYPLTLGDGAGDGDPGRSFRDALGQDVKGLRVAWSTNLGGLPVEAEVLQVLGRQRAVFEDLGCVVEDAEPDLSAADEAFDVLRALGFVVAHHQKLIEHRELLKDTVVWNIQQGLELTPQRIAAAVSARSAIVARALEFFERFDALVLPVSQVLPFPVEVDWVREIEGEPMEHYVAWQRTCSRITVTAHPAIGVPGGFTAGGLPVGLQIVGRYRDERNLLRLAQAFESATGFGLRRPPTPVSA